MSTIEVIAQSSGPSLAEATSEETVANLWFKTEPVDRRFCYRAVQLQLETLSSDQGVDDALNGAGSWSWFELAVFRNADSQSPVVKDGKALVWRSHGNRTDPLDTNESDSLHFGMIFDRRHDLFDAIEIGNVIGVRVCARYKGWLNNAQSGRLLSKFLSYDLFSPMSWAMSQSLANPIMNEAVKDGVYTLTPSSECHIVSTSDEQTDAIWFTTPILDEATISKIQDIQLFTVARHQGVPHEELSGNWSWFDLVILESPESKQPIVENERALVWRSHDVPIGHDDDAEEIGQLFGPAHDLFSHIKPGNVLGVRACTRFDGWELHGQSARLVVRISATQTDSGEVHTVPRAPVDWAKIAQDNKQLQEALTGYLDEATGEAAPAAQSVEATLLTQELRADWNYGQGERPLRLLALDGGGVKGISSLHVLKDIMGRIAGDPEAKPCDYFDMMAGTSTGGLIAIMLGRLEMSVDQCIQAYHDLAQSIFDESALATTGGLLLDGAKFSGEKLEAAIKYVCAKYAPSKDPEEAMLNPNQDACKAFVLSCRADDLSNRVATHMRTYINGNVEKSHAEFKIWEAGRATSAAPTFFPRIKLGEYEYIDAGVGFNNPVLLLMGEARLYYGFARPIGTLVTLGCGMNPNLSLPQMEHAIDYATKIGSLIGAFIGLATVSEHANIIARSLLEPGIYHRFNLGIKIAEAKWVETVHPSFWDWMWGARAVDIEHFTPENWVDLGVGLESWKMMVPFAELTDKYMQQQEQADEAQVVADKLPPKRVVVV